LDRDTLYLVPTVGQNDLETDIYLILFPNVSSEDCISDAMVSKRERGKIEKTIEL
jgi:hypothetical protein